MRLTDDRTLPCGSSLSCDGHCACLSWGRRSPPSLCPSWVFPGPPPCPSPRGLLGEMQAAGGGPAGSGLRRGAAVSSSHVLHTCPAPSAHLGTRWHGASCKEGSAQAAGPKGRPSGPHVGGYEEGVCGMANRPLPSMAAFSEEDPEALADMKAAGGGWLPDAENRV